MADNDDENLIGYDPLAWMHDQASDSATAETGIASLATEPTVDSEPSAVNQPEIMAAAEDGGKLIVLQSTQSIQNVQALHESLLQAFNQAESIEIDASAVQQIDTASLQLLLIAKQSGSNLQKRISIDFPSERFIEAANLLGLAEILEVDQAAAGFF